jgi:hypothetical protein
VSRLPKSGQDSGTWGQILNDFLIQSHNEDGSLKDGLVSTSKLANSSVTTTKISATGAASSATYLRGDGSWSTPSNTGGAQALTTTAVKTSAYTAAAGDLVPVDATSAAVIVTLSTAPADRSRIIIKKIDSSSKVVTVNAGGSDVFNKINGTTSISLSLQNQAIALQYAINSSIWYVVGDDLPLSQLDIRHGPIVGSDSWLKLHASGNIDALITGTISRDVNGAATSATVVWPDGTTGAYAATAVSIDLPGAVDAYTVTYIGSTTKTVTQPAVSRDLVTGSITTKPVMVVS